VSDLQCPARIVVVNPPALGDVAWLASSLGWEQVQAVYAADDVPDTGPVESLADDLGVPAHLGHGDLDDDSPGLEEVVDLHRGETVVVVRGGASVEPVVHVVDGDGVRVEAFRDPTRRSGSEQP
jgi:hypothetical protein